MINTVLFDLDGTIINTNELIIESFLYVLQKQKLGSISREQIIAQMGRPLRDQFKLFTGRTEVDELIIAYRDFNERMHDELTTSFPNVQQVISTLHSSGIRLGIVTTKARKTAEMGLKLCGLDTFMDTMVTIEDVEHPKPHPEPVLLAIQALEAVPHKTMMVGDSQYDIEAANHAGVTSVGVSWSLRGQAYLRQFQPDYMIHKMEQLLDIVGSDKVGR